MNQLITSHINWARYPHNLCRNELSSRKLQSYAKRLDEQEDCLFLPEDELDDDECLTLADLWDRHQCFERSKALSFDEVEQLCPVGPLSQEKGATPHLACRFVFLYSQNSRSALYSSRDMLMLLLTYHQVVPWFLDFLFPFGEQEEPQDARFSAFRSIVRADTNLAYGIKELGRSGTDIHLCYNLKAPEPSSANPRMPWSVRQTVMYHSFDTETGQAFWLVLKGNSYMRDYMLDEVSKLEWHGSDLPSTLRLRLKACLAVHLAACVWACEYWRPYVNYLEDQIDNLTGDGIRRQVRSRGYSSHHQPPKSIGRFKRTMTAASVAIKSVRQTALRAHTSGFTESSFVEKGAPDMKASAQDPTPPKHKFEVSSLQQSQHLQEKISEALFTIKNNRTILTALDNFYNRYESNDKQTLQSIAAFRSRLTEISSELDMHLSSFEALERLIVERKNLLFSILEFQSVLQAQHSADRMEDMTKEMKVLTQQMKNETVAMSVIAGVTMFFLPGTFVSTLMSTDIVKWTRLDNGVYEKEAAPGAWHLFLELTLPLMAATALVVILYSRYRSRMSAASIQKSGG